MLSALTNGVSTFNTTWASAVNSLRTYNPAVNVYGLNIDSLFTQLVAGTYPGYTFNDVSHEASTVTPVPTSADTYLFWDSIHPTEMAHKLLGDEAYALIASSQVAQPPVIGALNATPNPVTIGQNLTLTASSVTETDGSVVSVEFYRDVNGNGAIDLATDQLLGTGTAGGTGTWSWTGGTSGLPVGTFSVLARAEGITTGGQVLWSNPAATTLTTLNAPSTGLQVIYTDPVNGGPMVARNTNITIDFNEAMDFTTLNASTVTLVGSASGSHSAVYSYSGTRLTVDPMVDFSASETVTVTVCATCSLLTATGWHRITYLRLPPSARLLRLLSLAGRLVHPRHGVPGMSIC